MSQKQAGRWAGVVAAVLLLVLCTLLLWGTQTALATNPLPPSPASQPPGSNTAYSPHPASSPHNGEGSFRSPPPLGGHRPSLSSLHDTGDRGGGTPSILSQNDLVMDARSGSMPAIQQLSPGFTVDPAYTVIWGGVAAGDRVTVTRTVGGDAYGAAEADGAGFFWTPLWQASGRPAGIAAGDEIEVYVNGKLEATLDPQAVSGGIDVLTDQVAGAIAGDTGGTAVTLTVGLEGQQPGSNAPQETAVTTADGSFTADFAVDLGASNLVAVEYASGDHTVRAYLYPDARVFVVQNLDLVRGYADPGQQVDVTVYEGAGPTVRWSGSGTAGVPHGWYDIWVPVHTQPGDVVEVSLGGQLLSTTVAGMSITEVDTAADEITGTAPDGETVVIRLWQPDGYAETAATASGGVFTADLSGTADLKPRDTVYAAVADDEGDESLLLSGAPFIEALLNPLGVDCIDWRVDSPGLPVTLSIETSSGSYTRTGLTSSAGNGSWPYCYVIRDPDGARVKFAPGDTITVQSPTWEGSLVIADISWQADTAGDQVSGDAPAGDLEVTAYQWNNGQYPVHGSALQTSSAASPFTVQFTGFDVRDGGWIAVRHFDPTTGFATNSNAWGTLTTQYFQAWPWAVSGVPPSADEHIVVQLYDSDGTTLLAETDQDGDGSPWGFWYGDFQGTALQPGYWVRVSADSGWTAELQIPALTVEADETTELVWGDAPKSLLFVEHNWPDGWDGRFVPVDGYVLDWAFFGGDINTGSTVNATYQAVNGDRASAQYRAGEVFRAEFWLETAGRTWMWGEAQPGRAVTVTTPLGTFLASVDPSCSGCWNADVGNVFPGDEVTVTAAPGNEPVVITVPDPLTALADSATDEVWGQIGGWEEGAWIQIHGQWDNGYQEVQTDASGNYLATYDDVPRNGQGYMRADRQQGYTQVVFHRPFQSPDLVMSVNYGHDWVEGNYEPGYTVWLTVTDSLGAVKATVELETQVIPWWGGQSGFSTNVEEAVWVPSRPDIEVGDWVYGRLDRDGGYTSSARIGTIDGTLDIDADTVAGTISVPWFSGQTLNGNCGVWVENGPGQEFQVDPDGGSYSCDFTADWDLLPGQDVGVQYQEPDGDWVINVFREPAPDMRVEKWAEGSGQVAPGGPAIFTLRYRNEGDAPAATIHLTDTLPAGTTYVSDSSGATPDSGPGWVAWTLGPLDPGQEERFLLVLSHSADPGENLHNVAEISTLYDFNTGNNHTEADAQVVAEGQPDLNVNKNPNPGDPAAGQTMLWEINYGNNGPVASGPVVLSDTLPAGTSIVNWVSENGYSLWTDNSTAGQLRLEAPTLPGYWGDRILLRLLLDPDLEVGTQLVNTVEIVTADDANPDDNRHQRDDVWVNWPRWDGHVNKNLGWGRLVAGGEIGYNLHIRNHGNMATQVVITDTLPAGTTFDAAWQWTGVADVPFPPDSVEDGQLVWDLGVMEPGQWVNLNIRAILDADLEPGTELTNCADLAIDGDDGWPYDNSDCVVETVYEAGPNVRVIKDYQWNWEGQIQYTINFLNVGTTTLYDVVLTDTLPPGTSFNGNWWHWFWEGIDFAQSGDQLVWTLSRLEPGWSSGLSFQVDLDSELVGQQGLDFTNLVEAPVVDDVYAADNSSQVTAYTGPDVYVKKWLQGGELRLGEIVTFTVEFGNLNVGPWNGDTNYKSHITDTLPAAMTFITATAPWNPDERWQPEQIVGNSIVWEWGPMWSNNWWRFDVVAQITGPVKAGEVLINRVEAYGDSPNDVEPNYDNNAFELSLPMEGSRIFLPVVLRNR